MARVTIMAAIASGLIGVFFCKITAPSSSPSEGRNMVSPVSVSPLIIGQLMELGPRYFGSSDG